MGRAHFYNFPFLFNIPHMTIKRESLTTQYIVLQPCLKKKGKIGNTLWSSSVLYSLSQLISTVCSPIFTTTKELMSQGTGWFSEAFHLLPALHSPPAEL